MDIKDALYKVFWTVIAAGVAAIPVATADWPAWVVPIVAAVVNFVTAFARQKVGTDTSVGEPSVT